MKDAVTRPGSRAKLEQLRRHEEKLRTRRIALLKARLERARAEVRDLEKELRLAGVSAEELGGERTNWSRVLGQMPTTFTVAQLHAATGANQNLMSSVLHRWIFTKRIERLGRGTYRKVVWKSLAPPGPRPFRGSPRR